MLSNIYNNLLTNNYIFDADIQIKKININKNHEIFNIAYHFAVNSFFKELTETLNSETLYLFPKII